MTPTDEHVFDRLRTIAEGEAARTNPWPGLDRAIRRDRRDRMIGRGVTGVVVAAMLGAALVPSARHQVTEVASRLLGEDPAGQPIGGALGRDRSWTEPLTAALRDRLRADGRYEPETMRLLWTDELNGSRRAVVSARAEGDAVGSLEASVDALVLFAGGAGAGPGQLTIEGAGRTRREGGLDLLAWLPRYGSLAGDVTVLVLCPGCRDAEWVGRSAFGADLGVTASHGDLSRSGADTWQGTVPEARRPFVAVRATGPRGPVLEEQGGDGGGPYPAVPDLSELGVPVARRDAVAGAGESLSLAQGMAWPDVTAVRSARLTGPSFRGTLAAFRMPSGAWLVGSQTDPHPTDGWSSETVLVPPADPAALLVPLLTDDLSGAGSDNTLAVLAPDGAATVEADGRTFPVQAGGALLDFPSGIREQVRITARDAAGRELATTTWPLVHGAGKLL